MSESSREIKTGGVRGTATWYLKTDFECSDGDGGEPCKHCHSVKTVYWPGSAMNEVTEEKIWICPRAVYGASWSDTMAICLDCLLEELPK